MFKASSEEMDLIGARPGKSLRELLLLLLLFLLFEEKEVVNLGGFLEDDD